MLPCILLLTPAIGVIDYWDYRKKFSYSTKNCNFNSRLSLFQGSKTLKKYFVINYTSKSSISLSVDIEGTLHNSVALVKVGPWEQVSEYVGQSNILVPWICPKASVASSNTHSYQACNMYTAGINVWCGSFLAVNHHNHKNWVPFILTHNLGHDFYLKKKIKMTD